MLSPVERRQLADELAALKGAWVQKVSVSAPRVVSMELRLPGRSIGLRLDATSAAVRAGVVHDRLPSPQPPLPLQAILRAHLDSARLGDISARGRVLTFMFETPKGERQLLLEFDRRAADMVLVDGAGRVLAWADGEGPRARGLRRGGTYAAPAAEGDSDRPSRFAVPASAEDPFPVSAAIARAYAVEGPVRVEEGLRIALRAPLKSARDKLSRTLARVDDDLKRMDNAEQYRIWGELLKPHLSALSRGQSETRVVQYTAEGAREVVVPLLPALGPHENMQRYLHLHRRFTRSRGLAEQRRREVAQRLARCESLISELATADLSALRDMEARLRIEGVVGGSRAGATGARGKAVRVPYRCFRSVAGQPIWVGRNARDNDALTFGLARGNDLWLHVRGQTGSHVVLPGASAADNELLLDAAVLAAHFSEARGESRCEVVVTARKHVRKVREGAPGAVHYSQERTLPLRFDATRLSRLLASEQTADRGA